MAFINKKDIRLIVGLYNTRITRKQLSYSHSFIFLQVNKKFRKFERKYRDCIKRKGDKIGTQTCYVIST